jgi:hypothetical protein
MNILNLFKANKPSFDNTGINQSDINKAAKTVKKICAESKGENIIKTTVFDKTGAKQIEFTFKYDTKNNPFLTTPYTSDKVQSKNNVIETVGKDFTGLWDPIANPSKSKYCYNSSNFPTVQTTNIGYKYTFCYK